MRTTPKNLQTDLGKEFYNKEFQSLMNSLNINNYSTFSSLKASVERLNRTLVNNVERIQFTGILQVAAFTT